MWKKAAEVGILGTCIPEEYGGMGVDFRYDHIQTHQQYRRGLEGWGINLHNAIVVPYITKYGTEDQKKRLLPRLITGELITAIAMTEPGTGSDLQSIKTTAVKDGNGYKLNGQKTFITNGQTANLILVCAKTDASTGGKGVSIMLVETDLVEGNVSLPADAVLGGVEGQGFSQLMQSLPQERHLIGIQSIGSIERALAVTIEYVKERKAFGKSIFDFQNTQFKLAELKTEATIGRIFVDNCTDRLVKGELDTTTASMSKYWMTDLACKIVTECLQLHGGYGYMTEYEIAKLYKDTRVGPIYGGTNEIMKLLIARSI